ncbi:MAG TPA: YdeI/OmpD-associated family protein [Caulobacteraceae bacterium]|nr:YdeI/OmpD-associated family protein [Caulobacteraceae bacterium]
MQKTFTTTVQREGAASWFALPFDPREVFGKLRVPVTVTLNGYTYRSTIFDMGNGPFLPLRQSNRDSAGLQGGEQIEVTVALDTAPRTVTPPDDLVSALKAHPTAWAGWEKLSYTFQRENVEAIEGAKRPETREKRIGLAVQMAAERAAKQDAKQAARSKG